MENTNENLKENNHSDKKSRYINLKLKKPSKRTVSVVALAVIVILAVVFGKGLFVAASVNGESISRMSVIKELESQAGKQTLESLINLKLIKSELEKENIEVPSEVIDGKIQEIETNVTNQGGTLKEALAMQGLTEEKLREQLEIEEGLKMLLSDKTAVTEEEIDAYIKDTKIAVPKDEKQEDFKKEIKDGLEKEKFQKEAQAWISGLTESAKIKYYVNY